MSKKMKWDCWRGGRGCRRDLRHYGGAARQPTEVRIEAVDSRDLVASVTASGRAAAPRSTWPPTSRTHRQAFCEGRPDGEARRTCFRSTRAVRGRGAAPRQPIVCGAGGAGPRELPAGQGSRPQRGDRKTNPQLVSDADLEQTRTQMEVNRALLEASDFNVERSTPPFATPRTTLARQPSGPR
jgi:HlyD family secretion protein